MSSQDSEEILRLKDGYEVPRPHLNAQVKQLQRQLVRAGYNVETDGRFGPRTDEAVKSFQRVHGLVVDGIVGAKTWAALAEVAVPEGETPQALAQVEGLRSFRGDLGWVHAREGHAGRAYWPGGASGVTFDPGFDLGYQRERALVEHYQKCLDKTQMNAAKAVLGQRGLAARGALRGSDALRSIRISPREAFAVMPLIAERYWVGICERFPALARATTPPSVQTVMLSLAYNRGFGNDALEVLREPIESSDWATLGHTVRAMQQDHPLNGIRVRRRLEGDLVLAEAPATQPAPPAAGAEPRAIVELERAPGSGPLIDAEPLGEPPATIVRPLRQIVPRRYEAQVGDVVSIRIRPEHVGSFVRAAVSGRVLDNVGSVYEPVFRFPIEASPTFARLVFSFPRPADPLARYDVSVAGSAGVEIPDRPINHVVQARAYPERRIYFEFEAA